MQQEATTGQYLYAPLSLLGMLIRPKKKYDIPLVEPVREALENLSISLTKEADQDVISAIHEVFLKTWTTIWSPSGSNQLPCPTERCLALRSVQHDGSLRPPKGVSPDISKFEYQMRLTFLYEMHHQASTLYEGNMDPARKAMQRWFTEKVYSTFNTLRSLKHRATTIILKTQELPRSIWTDRTSWTSLLYKGNPVNLEGIRQVFVELDKQTFIQWEEKVLCGLKIRVDYSFIADDLTNKEVGYSFLSDPRNKEFHFRDRLAMAILADPELRARFTVEGESGVGWSKPAMREWLSDYAHLQGLEAARTEMLAGAPGRSTELHAMNYRNSKTRTSRNMVAWDKYITVMRMYTKTGAMTGNDKLIPHALDAFSSDLIIQDLAIARPFAELAVHVCYPGRKDIIELYRNRLYVNNTKDFDGKDLTHLMEGLTIPIFNFGITINSWRHIHTNFTKKLCNRMDGILLEGEADTPGVLQYGHGRHVHNSTYGISHDSAAGLPEDVLPYFLDASTDWQILCQVVPGEFL